jgi:membrane protease YdiL (CAAX protease family)
VIPTRETPERTAATAGLILVAAAALALRPAVIAGHPLSPVDRTWLLAVLYLAIGTASLLPPAPRDRASLSPAVVGAIGIGAIGLARWTAGPTAPLLIGPAGMLLSVVAAVAEEALFRRLAYRHLVRFGVPAAIVGTAFLFALVHIPSYGLAVFPVDLGAGLLFGWQRWAAGTWTVPAATHAAANLMAVIR